MYLRAIVTNLATNVVTIGFPVAVCNTDILGCHSDTNGNFGVTLDSQIQTLTQDIGDCIVNVTVGGVPGTGTCTFDLTTDLIL